MVGYPGPNGAGKDHHYPATPGRVQGRVETAYRDELTGRFDLDPSKKVRAYSKCRVRTADLA